VTRFSRWSEKPFFLYKAKRENANLWGRARHTFEQWVLEVKAA